MSELKKTGDDLRGFQKYFVCGHVGKVMVCSECPEHVVERGDDGSVTQYCGVAKRKRLGAFASDGVAKSGDDRGVGVV